MRELILVRHAHAESALRGQDDLDRPLSLIGHAEAESAAAWLKSQSLMPDRILCSNARRTRETLEHVIEALGFVESRLEPSIYEATPGTLMLLAEEHAHCPRLMIIGHNPGLEMFTALLHSGSSSEFRGMAPCAVSVLHTAPNAILEPGAGKLAAFWSP